MQFGFMPGKGTIYVIFILRRIQEKQSAKQKMLFMCFVYLEKAFDGVPMKIAEWAMRKKGIPAALVRTVMSQYKGASTRVIVGTHLSEELEANVGVHQESLSSPLLIACLGHATRNIVR